MSDELGEILPQVTPRRASPHLRVRVLTAVDRELKRRRKPRWERIFELSAAACLVLGIALNAWNSSRQDAWERHTFGTSGQDAIARGPATNGAVDGADTPKEPAERLADAQHMPQAVGGVWQRYDAILRELSQPFRGAEL